MGTVAEQAEPERRHERLILRADEGVRVLIAGHEVGAIRRISLYAIVAACLVIGGPAAALGLVALVFLATTDVLR